MVAAASVPVSCKIRVLDRVRLSSPALSPFLNLACHSLLLQRDATLALVREIERCGVAAIAVHGRQRDERPQDANREQEIAEIARMATVPIIAK